MVTRTNQTTYPLFKQGSLTTVVIQKMQQDGLNYNGYIQTCTII